MSRMLSKMNLISVVQQLPKEDIETIQGYVEMIEQENDVQKVMIENFVKENQQLKDRLQQKDEIINKSKEFVCDYKKQWVVNDEVVDDMEVLLKILDNKGE